MIPVSHPGRLLKRELEARNLSANRLALDLGVPSGRVTDILNGRRSITADTALRLGRYFGNGATFWIDLQSQYDIGRVEREHGEEIAQRVRPADAAWTSLATGMNRSTTSSMGHDGWKSRRRPDLIKCQNGGSLDEHLELTGELRRR